LLQFLYLAPVGVVKFDAGGIIDLINPIASAILMPMTLDATLINFFTVMAPVAPELGSQVAQFAHQAGIIVDQQRLETSVARKTMVLSLTVKRVGDGVHMAVLEDVTKIAAQERQLFNDREKFRAIFDHVRDYAIYTITLDGVVEEWNRSLERFGGWSASDVEGRCISIFLAPGDSNELVIEGLLADARRTGSVESEDCRRKRDGSLLWENTVITALPDETGAVRGFVVVSRDMTERKRSEDLIKSLATVDPLTGAYNRRYGDTALAAEFSRHIRTGNSFAALMLDVDEFKGINDRFGHQAGDLALQALVAALKRTLRISDTIVRYGGEEFLLLLPGADAVSAMVGAERVRSVVEATRVSATDGFEFGITVSIGVAVPTSNDPMELLRRCDVALYAAKAAGRNRIELMS
jgi:diguanylate cyclase (GGDEF)-like protein/PAS domain S-box-containing protein